MTNHRLAAALSTRAMRSNQTWFIRRNVAIPIKDPAIIAGANHRFAIERLPSDQPQWDDERQLDRFKMKKNHTLVPMKASIGTRILTR